MYSDMMHRGNLLSHSVHKLLLKKSKIMKNEKKYMIRVQTYIFKWVRMIRRINLKYWFAFRVFGCIFSEIHTNICIYTSIQILGKFNSFQELYFWNSYQQIISCSGNFWESAHRIRPAKCIIPLVYVVEIYIKISTHLAKYTRKRIVENRKNSTNIQMGATRWMLSIVNCI